MIRVVVVDDSAVMRDLVESMLEKSGEIKVVAKAVDAFDARDKIKQFNPDVITLDVEMPGMNGIEFLEKIMRLRPMPVVMFSTTTYQGSRAALDAMEVGAFDFVCKPNMSSANHIEKVAEELTEKVIAASGVSASKIEYARTVIRAAPTAVTEKKVQQASKSKFDRSKLIAIGASTGGTEAIKAVLTGLPENFPPIVIAQHIPPVFSKSFADRMDRLSQLTVHEAEQGQPIEVGHVYIAPGDYHLGIKKSGIGWKCHLTNEGKVNRHIPSVEVLFDSVIDQKHSNALGVMLTGMGSDGAEAMKRLKDRGIHTIVQDEASSIVWGMPGACVRLGAEAEVLGLEQIADRLIKLCVK